MELKTLALIIFFYLDQTHHFGLCLFVFVDWSSFRTFHILSIEFCLSLNGDFEDFDLVFQTDLHFFNVFSSADIHQLAVLLND